MERTGRAVESSEEVTEANRSYTICIYTVNWRPLSGGLEICYTTMSTAMVVVAPLPDGMSEGVDGDAEKIPEFLYIFYEFTGIPPSHHSE